MQLPFVISNISRHLVAYLYLPLDQASTKKYNTCNIVYTEAKGALKGEDNNNVHTIVRVYPLRSQYPYSLKCQEEIPHEYRHIFAMT
jgi:hypothetical protein